MYGVPNMKTDKMDVVQRRGKLSLRMPTDTPANLHRSTIRIASARSGHHEARGHHLRHWPCRACRRERRGVCVLYKYRHVTAHGVCVCVCAPYVCV